MATTVGFWKAFFDPENRDHERARTDLLVFDRDKILISQLVLSEVVSWLVSCGKSAQRDWLLDYAANTDNVRVFSFGEEELPVLAELSVYENSDLAGASLKYLKRYLNCAVTEY
ncbi:hypothetical protein L0Y65_01425 [Candidatus Micrarchaeota archaeon]|nr:hypothetical protein [Candidatus Micrarchaeota archaeon]